MLNPSLKELNPSLEELKEILKLLVKKRDIKDYKSMSDDRLLSAVKASESVKKVKIILMTQNQQEIKIMMLMKY